MAIVLAPAVSAAPLPPPPTTSSHTPSLSSPDTQSLPETSPETSPTPSASTAFTSLSSSAQGSKRSLVDLHPRSASEGAVQHLESERVAVCELAPASTALGPLADEDECGECGNPSITVNEPSSSTSASLPGKNNAAPNSDPASSGGFDRFGMPSEAAVLAAGLCDLVGESGAAVPFATLIRERERVVVVFLRHLWCGLCQEYVVALKSAKRELEALSTTTSISSISTPASTPEVNGSGVTTTNFSSLPPLYILLVSSGSPSLIPIYRARLGCPFPLYVDPTRKVYKALGMTRKSWSMGAESEKGSYATKTKLGNAVASTANGIAMPRYPGDQRQLGGEFVFRSDQKSGEIKCVYAARMSTTRNHSEVRDLFAAAGVTISQEDAESVFGGSSLGDAPSGSA